jgi:hypothetical protein
MKRRILLKSQQNDIFKYIENARLNHKDFQWIMERSSFGPFFEVPKLIHLPTNYYFKFDIQEGDLLTTECFPNEEGLVLTRSYLNWKSQFIDFVIWTDRLKNELETPDFWEASLNASKIFGPKADKGLTNELFTTEEQTYISAKLLEIENYLIEKSNNTSEDISFIKDKINYLDERSKRLGKKDWLNIVIGISFKIAVDIGLSSEVAKDFFKLVGTAFGHFLSGPVLLP